MLVVRTRPDPVAGQRELRSSTTLAGLPLTPIQTSSNDIRLFVPYVRDCQPRVLCRTVGAGTTDGISATEMAPTASVCRYCSWFASSWSTMHAPAGAAGTGLRALPRSTAVVHLYVPSRLGRSGLHPSCQHGAHLLPRWRDSRRGVSHQHHHGGPAARACVPMGTTAPACGAARSATVCGAGSRPYSGPILATRAHAGMQWQPIACRPRPCPHLSQ